MLGMIDTGATMSTLPAALAPPPTNQRIAVVGVSGTAENLPVSQFVEVKCAGQCVVHSFLITDECPTPLCGRDLLMKLSAIIMCSPDGMSVTFPDGTTSVTMEGVHQTRLGIMSMPESDEEPDPPARVYWMLLQPETDGQGIFSLYVT